MAARPPNSLPERLFDAVERWSLILGGVGSGAVFGAFLGYGLGELSRLPRVPAAVVGALVVAVLGTALAHAAQREKDSS